MKPSKSSIVTAMVVTAALCGAGASYAEPAPSDGTVINYQTTLDSDTSTTTTIDAGAFRFAAGAVAIADDFGTTLASLPLTYSVDGVLHPIEAAIGNDGRQLTLMPEKAAANATDVSQAVDRQNAWNNAVSEVMIGWNNGGLMATGIGATIGQVVGCIALLLNPIVGCVLGTAVGAGIGALVGVIRGNEKVPSAVFKYFRTFIPEGGIPGIPTEMIPNP